MKNLVPQNKKKIVFDATKSNDQSASFLFSCKVLLHIALVSSAIVVKSWFSSDLDPYVRRFAKSMLSDAQVKLEVSGAEKLDPDQAYLFMSNHPSAFDIPVLMMAIPHRLRMVAKEQLMKIPVFGHAMHKTGFVPIDRKNPKKAVKQLELAKERLNEGFCIWIAPEGTRSPKGKLGRFKKGGFHMAKALGVPIIPIWIEGTREVIAPDEYAIHPNQSVHVVIGNPVEVEDKNVDELMQAIRNDIESLSNYA